MCDCRFQWPCVLWRESAAARLLGLWVRIPPGAWMSVSCECCLLSARGLCIGMITRPEESYPMWCVWIWSWIPNNEEALDHWSCCAVVKIVWLVGKKRKLNLCFLRSFVSVCCWCKSMHSYSFYSARYVVAEKKYFGGDLKLALMSFCSSACTSRSFYEISGTCSNRNQCHLTTE